jgi:copper chaperone CopZ
MKIESQWFTGWWRMSAVAVAVGGALVATSARPTHAGERAPAGRVTLEVPEVTCAGCSLPVRKALKQAGGVTGVEEGATKTRIIVSFEPAAGRPGAYVDAIRRAGFPKTRAVEGS